MQRAVKAKAMQKTEAVDAVVRACEELAQPARGGRS
jgi:UDP-N-acetylglucosamine--N-acetylmuramyl-(pentapeptide) pyrophosphoryl-undecaprenol N-acetylglucosamine transferase